MIPAIEWTQIVLGPVTIQVWGLFVALGVVASLAVLRWYAKREGLSVDALFDASLWILIAGFIGARLFFLLTDIDFYISQPAAALAVWDGGMSISGGFLFAVLAGLWWVRRKQVPLLVYADAIAFAVPIGLAIGRLGCFFIFDHPGSETDFFLGQEYADGTIRHNHGCYLCLNGLCLTGAMALVYARMRQRPPGVFLALFLTWYGTVRFILDFFRATDLAGSDPRFLGLTIAQYTSIAMVVVGCGVWYAIRYGKKKTEPTERSKT